MGLFAQQRRRDYDVRSDAHYLYADRTQDHVRYLYLFVQYRYRCQISRVLEQRQRHRSVRRRRGAHRNQTVRQYGVRRAYAAGMESRRKQQPRRSNRYQVLGDHERYADRGYLHGGRRKYMELPHGGQLRVRHHVRFCGQRSQIRRVQER